MSELRSERGKITALSHVLYIRPKSLFLELLTESATSFVLIEDREQQKKWKGILKVRECIQIDNLKTVKIKGHPGLVFKTTSHSEVKIIEKMQKWKPKNKVLISYQGVVTDDSWSAYGFYVLDETLILCLSYVKLVSNVPIIKQGDTIVLHEVHHIKIENDALLYICGRGSLTNTAIHEENRSLFPRTSAEDSANCVQNCALEHNCNIVWLFSLFKLTESIGKRLAGIAPNDILLRKCSIGNNKGIISSLFDGLSSYFAQPSRSLTKEFLDHEANCALGIQPKESLKKIEDWRLNSSYIETKCDHLKLWSLSNVTTTPVAKEAAPDAVHKSATTHQNYWKHEIASIDSSSQPIILLFGVLAFHNGHWQLKDNSDSIPCIIADRLHNQFKNRCVFATKFHVHRETFAVEDREKHEKRIYLSIDELHAASLPILEPKVSPHQLAKETIRFLVLSRSMPMMIFSNDAAKRNVFGVLLTASLYGSSLPSQESPWRPKKPKAVKDNVSSDDQLPINCILAFSYNQSCIDSSFLNEGRVYEMCFSKQELLKQRIYLPSLKDIPNIAMRSHVFMIPNHVGVYPVLYNLPKTESFTRGDVLSVGECLVLEDVSQTISLRGWIVDRMHVDSKFGSERISQKQLEEHLGNWLGTPGNKKIVLKICASPDSPLKVDVYLSLNEKQVYPFGLFQGSEVELTWLNLRKTRNTSRVYCISTVLTGIRILQIASNTQYNYPLIDKLKNASIGRHFFFQLKNVTHRVACSVLATVRYIHKLSIRCLCFGCKTDISNGKCSYVGCHWTSEPRWKIDLKAWCTVEDGTGQALVFIGGESCQRWLSLPPNVWKLLEEQVLPHEGEFIYLTSKTTRQEASVACRILSYYCTSSTHLRRPLRMVVRKMFDNEVKPSSTYYFREQPSVRFFCLDVKEMDPAALAIELASAPNSNALAS